MDKDSVEFVLLIVAGIVVAAIVFDIVNYAMSAAGMKEELSLNA